MGQLKSLLRPRNEPVTNHTVTFKEFVTFVTFELREKVQSYGSLHWLPFTKLCGLCHIHYDFLGKLETLPSDIAYLAQSSEQFSKFSLNDLFSVKFNKNGAKTHQVSKEYFSTLKKETVKELAQLYHDDFSIGGYDYPQEYIDVAK